MNIVIFPWPLLPATAGVNSQQPGCRGQEVPKSQTGGEGLFTLNEPTGKTSPTLTVRYELSRQLAHQLRYFVPLTLGTAPLYLGLQSWARLPRRHLGEWARLNQNTAGGALSLGTSAGLARWRLAASGQHFRDKAPVATWTRRHNLDEITSDLTRFHSADAYCSFLNLSV